MDAIGLEFLHRELVDRHVLLERLSLVTVIVDALQHDDAWQDAGDIVRRRTAYRIAFVSWRLHERQGWHDALRNRREDR